MKRALKLLLWVFTVALVLTLAQAATFVGVWEIEWNFLTTVWQNPLEWLGTITLWKYAALAFVIVVVIVVAFISLIQLIVRKSKSRRCKCKECEQVESVEPVVTASIIVDEPKVVHKGRSNTGNPGKFTRVHHDHK